MGGIAVLEREVYSETEAARLLRMPPSTLHYWLEGGRRRGRTYRPIIRVEPRGGHLPVTWAEFVEAGLLRQYRQTANVPMAELRNFIDIMRAQFDTPYPLAHERPYVLGRELIARAQDEADLAPDYCLVAVVRGQYVLTGAVEQFLRRVTWEHDVPAQWRPHDDEISPVRIDPNARFGRPMIEGISTEALWEHHQAGETDAEIAELFDLTPDQVRWAIAYETSARPAA